MTLCLAAYLINVHSGDPSIEIEIAHQSVNDRWFNQNDDEIWPFWTTEIEIEVPSIPEGWIDYLYREADKFAASKPSPKEEKVEARSLLASLGLPTKVHSAVSGKLNRRI